MRRLAVIPAREGSKRIPHKNIRDFNGRPMVTYPLAAAQDSKLFDVIHVSTDSAAIEKIAAECGAAPDFSRLANLADDHTPLMDVLKYVVEEYERRGHEFDTVAILYATSPLMSAVDLQDACEVFEEGDKSRALLSVAPYPAPIEKAFRMDDSGALSPDNEAAFGGRSQELSPAYHDAAMFCFYTPAFIKARQGAGDFTKFSGFVVPSYRVTDIDNPEDWTRAEMMYRAVKG